MRENSKRKKFFALAVLLFLSLFAHLTIMQSGYPVVSATGTTDRNSLMTRIYNSFKDYVFGVFRSDYFDCKFWNATDYPSSLLLSRDHLLDVALADTVMYEITGDIRYMHEAQFIMEGLESYIHEGFSLLVSGNIYGFTSVDPLLWLTMARLNQLGFGNYDINYMIEKLMSFAVFDNETDLAWTRGYTDPDPWEGQVTFNKMYLHPVLFAYLTKEGFGDYSNHIKRIFHYWERWRGPDGGYPYDNRGGRYIETYYTNHNLFGLVVAHRLLPGLWDADDLSSIQQTISYYDERVLRSDILRANAVNYVAGQGLFTFPPQYVRSFHYIWDLWDAQYWMWSELKFDMHKILGLGWARTMFIALAFNPDFTKPTLTPKVMLLNPNQYGFSTSLSNVSHQWRQGPYGISPTFSSIEYLDVLYGQNPTFSYIGWNGTHYVGIAEEAGIYVELVGHKYFRFQSIQTNVTTTLRWTRAISPYLKYQLFFANKTVIDLTENATHVIPEGYFLINNARRWGDDGLYCVKTDASKFNVSITSTAFRLTFNITEFNIGFGEHAADLSKQWVKERFAEILTHFKDNINFKCRDTLFDAARMEKWVKWLDPFLLYSSNAIGNMSSFEYTDDKLIFIITAPTSVTSTTKIYVGDKGEPLYVSGATSWSYDAQREIVEVTVTHESAAEIVLEWGVHATVDIKPDTLNLKSKSKRITAYIELPEGYNVDDVDIYTVTLNNTGQAELHPAKIGDYDNDGVLDLMVKFDRVLVVDLLSVGEATLTITGEVAGTPFQGSDTIRVNYVRRRLR